MEEQDRTSPGGMTTHWVRDKIAELQSPEFNPFQATIFLAWLLYHAVLGLVLFGLFARKRAMTLRGQASAMMKGKAVTVWFRPGDESIYLRDAGEAAPFGSHPIAKFDPDGRSIDLDRA